MTPAQKAKRLRAAMPKIESAVNQYEVIAATRAYSQAIPLSAGTVSTETLSKRPPGLNHPYGIGSENGRGRRGPVPYGDPGIINRQDGQFFAAWRVTAGPTGHPALINPSPYAGFLETGTRLMIARPIRERILSRILPGLPALGVIEINKALP